MNNANREALIARINRKYWWHVPPQTGEAAYQERGKFFGSSFEEVEQYGKAADAERHRVKVSNPLIGDHDEIEKRLGVPGQREGETYEQMIAADKRWAKAARAKGYDAIAFLSKKSFADFKKTGKLPRSIELNILTPVGARP